MGDDKVEEKSVKIDLRVLREIKDQENVALVLRQMADALEARKMRVEPPVSPENPLDSGKRSVDSIMQFGQNMGLRRARDILLRGAELLEKPKKG